MIEKSLIKIAVTGANGFVGRHLCRHLAKNGFEVTALVRDKNYKIDGAKVVHSITDINDLTKLSLALNNSKIVIHLAGRAHVLRDSEEDPTAEFRKSNIDYTRALLKAASDSGVTRLVYVSSIGVNGPSNIGSAFQETDIEHPYDPYSDSKLAAEKLVQEAARNHGMEYVIVRPTLIFGPDAPGNVRTLLKIASSNLPLPFNKVASKRNILSIWNFVSFLNVSATHPAAADQIFLVADDQEVTLADILKYLRVGMNKRVHIFSFPIFIMKYLAMVLKKKKAFDKLNSNLVVDSGKARILLGWQPPYDTFSALKRTGFEYESKRE